MPRKSTEIRVSSADLRRIDAAISKLGQSIESLANMSTVLLACTRVIQEFNYRIEQMKEEDS